MQEHVENKKSSVYENISFAVVHTDAQQIFFFFFFLFTRSDLFL